MSSLHPYVTVRNDRARWKYGGKASEIASDSRLSSSSYKMAACYRSSCLLRQVLPRFPVWTKLLYVSRRIGWIAQVTYLKSEQGSLPFECSPIPSGMVNRTQLNSIELSQTH